LAVSQFGVMFFADPYAAFANIATNLRPGGRLLFACWRPLSENPWTKIPMAAIRDLLPPAAPVDSTAPPPPGPFSLGDRERLVDIVSRAGFVDINVDAVDIDVCFAAAGGVDEAMRLATQIGPAASALAELSPATKADGAARIKSAIAPFEKHGRVELGGAIWMVHATTANK
jgi:SAM-dependent methyltransferase